MTKLLLSVHVLAAILAIGPIAVAASLFPRFARESPTGVAVFLHRTCRTYAGVGIAVPVFGVATGVSLGVLGDAWLLTSVVLTAIAAGLLVLAILPVQRRVLAGQTGNRLAMSTGVFNLLWAVVVVLMIVRPGSTTGA
ncbi:hypothetical protein F4560_003208 [Saccharothrix ecbatanensis]|uniref:Uncharacterized protein n=1 Tax=Saccharothrix ecbatanensis TaxID=1105145 RepID=A0A7W9M0Z3_9PSEU|nr:hypothetical protein [Saccharothrix ecbatanensis]MBB5803440.1 hypothetical protein [Saccharothrix ecbatanensis]